MRASRIERGPHFLEDQGLKNGVLPLSKPPQCFQYRLQRERNGCSSARGRACAINVCVCCVCVCARSVSRVRACVRACVRDLQAATDKMMQVRHPRRHAEPGSSPVRRDLPLPVLLLLRSCAWMESLRPQAFLQTVYSTRCYCGKARRAQIPYNCSRSRPLLGSTARLQSPPYFTNRGAEPG